MSTEVTTVKPSQLATILAATIKAKLPMLITGAPGIGKSDVVEQATAAAGARLLVEHPVVNDPTDAKGMPWVTNGKAKFLPFGNLELLIDAKEPTVSFLDDLGQAPTAVQGAYMHQVLARQINGHKISDQVVFIGATNRRNDRAGVSGILEPLKGRFGIVEMAADVDDFIARCFVENVDPSIPAFMRFRPALLSDFKPTADMTNSPSPRGWISPRTPSVNSILQLNLPNDLQIPMFEGAVGRGAAGEFAAFYRVWQQMVSPDLILTNPDTAAIPTDVSALFAISGALAQRVKAASVGRYFTYLERVNDADGGDYCAASIKSMLARDPKLANTAGYIKAMSGPLGQLMIG